MVPPKDGKIEVGNPLSPVDLGCLTRARELAARASDTVLSDCFLENLVAFHNFFRDDASLVRVRPTGWR